MNNTVERIRKLEADIRELQEFVGKFAMNRAIGTIGARHDKRGVTTVEPGWGVSLEEVARPYARSPVALAVSLFFSFAWSSTPQGFEYWEQVMSNLQDLRLEELPASPQDLKMQEEYL